MSARRPINVGDGSTNPRQSDRTAPADPAAPAAGRRSSSGGDHLAADPEAAAADGHGLWRTISRQSRSSMGLAISPLLHEALRRDIEEEDAEEEAERRARNSPPSSSSSSSSAAAAAAAAADNYPNTGPAGRDFLSSSPFATSPYARRQHSLDVAAMPPNEHSTLASRASSLFSADGDPTTPGEDGPSGMAPMVQHQQYSMASSYHHGGFTSAGSRATVVPGLQDWQDRAPTRSERRAARREERSLLRDNNMIPPKHPQQKAEDDEDGVEVVEEGRERRSFSIAGSARNFLPHWSRIPGGERKVVAPGDAAAVSDGEDDLDMDLDDDDDEDEDETGAGPNAQDRLLAPRKSVDSRPSRRSLRLAALAAENQPSDSVAGAVASETTPLIGDPTLPYGGLDDPKSIDQRWEAAVAAGKIQTSWRREAKVLARYAAPLVVTFLLQYSLTVASIFTVGHLGTVELGAVSLASMSSMITGYAIYQGLATSLDTLCAQAYGSGRRKLVGLYAQRMVLFLWVITIPIAILWLASEPILLAIVPEREVAVLAGKYLRILILGAPGYAAFESGKRYLQAQGLFTASLYILIVLAPLNALMNWLFVWRFGWGFIGAPIAVVITDNLLPVGLGLYVRFVAGSACWPGLTRRAWHNWWPMIKLALPGLLMVEAECLAFEVLTLASSYFGTTALAAQSVLATTCSITWQLPFPLSIATSTRIANLIGATLADAAKVTARVSLVMALFVGALNFCVLAFLRWRIPVLFSGDDKVIAMVAAVLPLCATFQFADAVAGNCDGILRGLGRQEIGGYVQVVCYYLVAMPISMGTSFGLGWGLYGLWLGVAIALMLVFLIEGTFLYRASWERSVEEARYRNDIN